MEWNSPNKKALCPCGSGERYGGCCGQMDKQIGEQGARFAAMKSIAYKGKIGRKREEYCIAYIRRKHEIIEAIRKTLETAEDNGGDTITCVKGCSVCCSMYVEASIQECEAIVYYLYNHGDALASFLASYPGWRTRLRERGDIFKGRNRYWEPQPSADKAAGLSRDFTQREDKYFAQGIPCPFLAGDSCEIYEVRPFVCASYAAVTPAEYCRADSIERPKVVKAVPQGVRADRSFYYPEHLPEHVLSTMAIMVFEILKSGLSCFSKAGIKGLESLDSIWFSDPAVSHIYRKYLR